MTDAYVAPPSLRHMFPATKAPKVFAPQHVEPFLRVLVDTLNKKLPADCELVKDGELLTIRVDIHRPGLPAGPSDDE